MPELKLHESVSPELKQQYLVATSGFDSQEPTLTMTPMGLSANPELSNWYELVPRSDDDCVLRDAYGIKSGQFHTANTAQAKSTCRCWS